MSFYKQTVKSDGSNQKFYAKKRSVINEELKYHAEPNEKPKKFKRSDSESEEEKATSFIEDWNSIRQRHKGQQEIIESFFDHGKKYIFVRFGRKGAKTATNIDIAWRFANTFPRSTTFICLPSITQAIEVYWDEKRLQWCDIQDPWMFEKYVEHVDNNKHMLTFTNGSIIKLIGTWSESRGRGTQPNLLIVDELADCSGEYLDAMEPNLAAKPDARCIMSGTPPKKKNHFHEWEDRIRINEEGFRLHYSSYINTALPHLASWLDKKKIELIAAGKEDVWLREYMAEDCFRSDERVLPDIKFYDIEELLKIIRFSDSSAFYPVVGVVVTEDRICVTYSALLHSRYVGTKIYTFESNMMSRIWDMGYHALEDKIKSRIEHYSSLFSKSWRKVVSDSTDTLSHVLTGFFDARKDLKWQTRGVPLLREMILSNNIMFADSSSDIGVEAQNLLKEDDVRDYPHVCCMAMLANEYYQPQSLSKAEKEVWDKFAPLRDAGIPAPMPKRKGKTLFQKNWG